MRYLVFLHNEARGGANDFAAAFRTLEEAKDHAVKLLILEYDNGHIFDTDALKIVWTDEEV